MFPEEFGRLSHRVKALSGRVLYKTLESLLSHSEESGDFLSCEGEATGTHHMHTGDIHTSILNDDLKQELNFK